MANAKSIVLIVSVFTLFLTSYSQSRQDKNLIIASIRNTCGQINVYKSYKRVTIDDAEEFLGHATDNGASLTGYFKDDSLKKIAEWIGLSNKIIRNDYYFNKGKLIFIYSKESSSKFDNSGQKGDYSKVKDSVFTGGYYFINEEFFDAIFRGKQRVATQKEDAANFVLAAKEYFTLLTGKKK